MKQILCSFGPIPVGSNSAGTGFLLLAIGLLGLLNIAAKIAGLNWREQWPKLALHLIVLLFFVIGGLVILSKRL
jgi:hypothetical protein